MRIFFSVIITTFSFLTLNGQTLNVFDIARKGTLNEIETIYKKDPTLINSIDQNKFSPLILACYRENIEVAKFLITHVANINYSSDMGTALMAATYKNQVALVQLLLENKADVNATDAEGTTPLMLAVQFKNIELTKLLLKYKADKSIKDKKGKTAFEYAVFANDDQIINLLKQ